MVDLVAQERLGVVDLGADVLLGGVDLLDRVVDLAAELLVPLDRDLLGVVDSPSMWFSARAALVLSGTGEYQERGLYSMKSTADMTIKASSGYATIFKCCKRIYKRFDFFLCVSHCHNHRTRYRLCQ